MNRRAGCTEHQRSGDTQVIKQRDDYIHRGDEGMDISAEIARREARQAAIAEAKAKIEALSGKRDATEQASYQQKVARREAQRKAGKTPRGRDPEPPTGGPRDKDQVNLTYPQSRIMSVTGKGFDQCYNAQAAVDTDTLLDTHIHVIQATNDKQQVMPLLTTWKATRRRWVDRPVCWPIPATSVPLVSRPAMTTASNRY